MVSNMIIVAIFALILTASQVSAVGLGGACAGFGDCTFAGQYCDTTCKVCPVGSYCAGGVDKVACGGGDAGLNSPLGSTAASDCTPVGVDCSGAGTPDATLCLAGSYASANDATCVCTSCPADHWCENGVATKFGPTTANTAIKACGANLHVAGGASLANQCLTPTQAPTSAPTFTNEGWGQITWDKRRHRNGGLCENHCSNHGTCEKNSNCKCFTGLDGEAEWTGPDCSLRTCPRDFAWVGDVINSNNLHPWVECSNKGSCDRKSGTCKCFAGYDGVACQRSTCPDNCNDRGTCWPEKHLATKASRTYNTPWDSMKHVGCFCDAGYRGPACELQECPSGTDPLDGYGNEAGRDCSGRGLCDYEDGTCTCFSGFYGTHCQYQTTVF